MSKAATVARAEEPAGGWRLASQRFASSAVVLLVGIGATVAAGYLQYIAQLSEAREHFAGWSEERRQQLSGRIDAHIEALYGVRSLFDSSEFVSQQEFDRFTSDSLERHRHIRFIDFLRRVAHRDRARFEELCRKLFDSEFLIFDYSNGQAVPATSRPEYVPIVYTQPAAKDGKLGMDVAVDPRSAATMRATDKTRSSSALIIPERGEQGDPRRWIHVYLPVYARPSADASVLSVVLSPAGYVRVRFVLDDMLADMAREARAAGIEIRVLESTADNASSSAGAPPPAAARADWRSPLAWSAEIAVANRNLSLHTRATERYAGQPRLTSTLPLVLTGLAITLLGAIGSWQLARSRLRSQALAGELLVEIRERRSSEQRTAQSEVRHRVLVENSPDAILLYQRGRTIFVNRAALSLFGAQTQEQLLGKSVFELIHPDFHDVVSERTARMINERAMLPPLEARLTRLDGSAVEAEIVSVPYLSDGEVTLQVTMRDVTERRHSERERIRLEAALRQSQRLEAIGTLTGGIAHDFNNILGAIVGNIQLLLQDLPEGHPAWRSVQEIRSATQRARDLVKRLTTFSTQQEAPRTAIELAPLIAEVQQLLRPALPAGVALLSNVPPDTPAVMADATQLHQVLVNLCTNAWQSMSSAHGAIRISVSTLQADEARQQSQAALQGAARYVCIEVLDNGSGIPAEIIERIFEPFFTTKQAGEGSGLGLAMVHGIVQSHKGAISVSSRMGMGTSFRVYLPASESSAAAAKPLPERPRRGVNQHVLYIDDEESLVFVVKRMLERGGYRCTGETDPRQAIAAVRSDPAAFDLVITDLNMPTMSGIDVASELQQLRPDLPVVITTGYIRAADVALVRSLSTRDLILKPDTIEELPSIVSRYLRQTGTGD